MQFFHYANRWLLPILGLASVALSSCASGSQNENTFPLSRTQQAVRSASESIVLPHNIDPSGRAHRVAHGTAVYVLVQQDVSWRTVENGKVTEHVTAPYNVQSVNRSGSLTTIVLVDGTRYTVPNSAIITDRTERDIGFVAPGRPVPQILRGRKPDFIVP